MAFLVAVLGAPWASPAAPSAVVTPGAASAAAPRELTAGVLTDWPPQYVTDGRGQPSGFAVEILEAVADRSGLQVRYRTYGDFPSLAAALSAGEIDLIPNFGSIESRQGEFLFTRPVESFSIGLFVRASSPILELEDVPPRRLGVVATNVGVEVAAARGRLPRVFGSVEEALLALLSSEVDAVIYPDPVFRALARGAGLEDEIDRVGPDLMEVARAMALHPKHADLLPRLDAAIEELTASAEYGRIYARWHGAPESAWPRAVLLGALAALAVAVLVLAAWRQVSVRRLGRRVEEKDRRFHFLVENLSEGVLLTGDDGRIAYVNRSGASLLGRSREALLGTRALELVPESDREAAARKIEERLAGLEDRYETALQRPDGTQVWVEVHAVPYAPDGPIRGSLATLTDVSARKQAEARARSAMEQRHRAQHLESMGRLTAGIAHDFNNLLTAIAGPARLLDEDPALSEEQRAEVRAIVHAADRATALTRRLLAFGKRDGEAPEHVALDRALAELEPLLRRLVTPPARLVVENSEVPETGIDRARLEQVLVNLVVNAREAIGEEPAREGLVRIRVRSVRDDEGSERVELLVEDNGAGMSEDTAARAFEPFFTTKQARGGTGLGLDTVESIVRESGGRIELRSRPGEGTSFLASWPAVGESPSRATAAAPASSPAREAEEGASPGTIVDSPSHGASGDPRPARILVVDDEETVRELMRRVLAAVGHELQCAASGLQALEALDERPGLDLLVTDVVMPEMRGPELARRVRERQPGVPVLFVSAHVGQDDAAPLRAFERSEFLRKPFTPEELRRAVAALLPLSDAQPG